MSHLFNYGTQGIWIGGNAPYSAGFESIAATPINGVQSSQITLNYPREEIMDWAGGGEPVLPVRPTAQLQFSYVFGDGPNPNGINESYLGFVLNGAIPALINLNNERNYYVFINQDHHDLIGYQGSNDYVMAFGNGVITRYDFNAAVGRPTTCDVIVDCLNLLIQGTGSGNPIPSVEKHSGIFSTGIYTFPAFSQNVTNYFEAAPGNIVLSFDTGSAIGAIMSGNVSCLLQSFGFSIDLPRISSKNLGWAYPSSRSVHWPVTISIHAEAYLDGLQADALNRFGCPDSGWNFSVGFNSGFHLSDPFSFKFVGAKLDNEVITASITDFNKVSLNWTVKIYDINRTDSTAGNFFINYPQTAYGSIIFSGVNWGTGAGQSPLIVNLSQSGYLSIAQGPGVLNGNTVTMLNEAPNQVIVQINVSGSSEVDQITATIQ